MNNLFSHIEYLLLSRDCVIVPGLGAFLTVVRPAAIDYDKGLITPPSRSVIFNQAISSDDGLLASSYARKHSLSFEEARRIVSRDAAMLMEKLTSCKEIEAGNFGVLKYGDEGNMMFTPRLNFNIACSPLGFETLKLTKAADSTTTNESAKASSPSEANDADSCHTSFYQFSIKKDLSRIAVAVAVLAIITIAAIFNPIPDDNREQRASVVPVEAIIPLKAKDNAKNIATQGPAKAIDNTADSENNLTKEEANSAHYLIVATFSSNREALKYVADNSSSDCPMQTVESLKVTRVAIASSNDREDLRKRLNSKEIRRKYPNAWIWSRN